MDDKIVFLDIMIVLTFLSLMLSYVFLDGFIDLGIILILLFVYILAYKFIYKFGNFQKVLFILSICSFVFFMSLFGYWSFNSYLPLLIILNWYIIWLIFKNEDRVNFKYVGVKQFVLMAFIFYLFFNLVLIFSPYNEFNPLEHVVILQGELSIWGILGICLLSLSVILSMVFVARIVYGKSFSLSYDDVGRFGK